MAAGVSKELASVEELRNILDASDEAFEAFQELINAMEDGAVVTPTQLIEAGLLKKTLSGVKVLGGEKMTKKLTVRASKFSASAKQAIEEAGGTIEVID